MKTARDVKAALLDALADVLDVPMAEVGFKRRPGTAAFVRALENGDQRVLFLMDCFPTYESGAVAHVHPALEIRMAGVSEVALKLVGGNALLLAGAPDIVVKQPIDLLAPKERHIRWFAYDRADMWTACRGIYQFLAEWAWPFLAELATPSDLVRAYETGDSRILRQRHWYVFVVAAYVLLNESGRARAVAKDHFGSPWLQSKYASMLMSLGS
jgi:hypothetical protein